MITEYLLELLEHLPRTSSRRRVLKEVEDHLIASAAELHADGLDAASAEREATRRFGDPAAMAEEFVQLEVGRAARSAGRRTLVLAVACGLPALASTTGPGGRVVHLAAFVLAQVALVVGGLTFARGWIASALLVRRGVSVVLGCGLALAVCAIAGGLVAPGAWTAPAWILLAVQLAAVGGCGHALVNLRRLGHARVDDLQAHDAAVDLQALAHRAGIRLPARLLRWVDLRRHPWRFALVVSLGAGLALATAHGVAEGPPPPGEMLRGVMAAGIITAIEALAALSGFALLGSYLRIRRPGGSQPSSVR